MASRKSLTDLQQHEMATRTALAKKKQSLAQAQAQLRAAEQKARTRHRAVVGKLVLAHAPLAALDLDQLQEALTALARCLADPVRWQAFLWDNRVAPAPSLEPCSLPCISVEIRENGGGE